MAKSLKQVLVLMQKAQKEQRERRQRLQMERILAGLRGQRVLDWTGVVANVISYSAAMSAFEKGQARESALHTSG